MVLHALEDVLLKWQCASWCKIYERSHDEDESNVIINLEFLLVLPEGTRQDKSANKLSVKINTFAK